MPVSALLLALGAAFVHALWNLLLARARDVEAATAVALVVAVVAWAPVTVLAWEVDGGVWPYLVATGVFEIIYFALLATAYRRAELSLVYPLARGSAPVLVFALGALVGFGASWLQGAGVVLVGVGVMLVRGIGRTGDRTGVALALAIAVCIASYTLIDKRGLQHADPITYLELSMIGPSLVYAGAMLAIRGRVRLRAEVRPPTIAAGLAVFGAYALALAALERASAASVAAVRETSVVIATLLAGRVLAERVSPPRLAGAVLVAGGVALLSL